MSEEVTIENIYSGEKRKVKVVARYDNLSISEINWPMVGNFRVRNDLLCTPTKQWRVVEEDAPTDRSEHQ